MSIHHASGEQAIQMGIGDKSKEGFVQVRTKDQKGLIQLDADEYGGSMRIFKKGDQNVLQAGVLIHADSNGGYMSIHHASGEEAIRLADDEYGGGMAIFNKGGKNVLQASVGNMGGGIIQTYDKHGYKTGRLP